MHKLVAEFFGTFILVFFGCGVVHTATMYGTQVGLWQIAIVWGHAVLGGKFLVAVGGERQHHLAGAPAFGRSTLLRSRLLIAYSIVLLFVLRKENSRTKGNALRQ